MRNLGKMVGPNDGTRTLYESTMLPEVIKVIQDWKSANIPCVLIGGLAISFYVKPRVTQDLDFLMMSDFEIPNEVPGFKKIRKHAFQHNETHVEVEIVTPEFVGVPVSVFQKVVDTSKNSDGIQIASPSGLVALKLFSYRLQDKSDIANLLNNSQPIDISGFGLPNVQIQRYTMSLVDAEHEKTIFRQEDE